MSYPSIKSVDSEPPKECTEVPDKPVKIVKKSFSGTPAKSKIPKQGKAIPVACKDAESADTVVLEKQEEPPLPVPTPRPMSKSQEKSAPTSVKMKTTTVYESTEKRVLENKFNQKKNRFITLTRDIEDKQKLSVSSFKELYQLREKILLLGGKDPGLLNEINPLGSWFMKKKPEDNNDVNEGSLLAQIETVLISNSDGFRIFCLDAIKSQKETITWLTNFEREYWDSPSPLDCKEEMARQCENYKYEVSKSEKLYENLLNEQMSKIKELTLRISFIWQEYQNYRQASAVGDGVCVSDEQAMELRREKEKYLKLRAKLREQEAAIANAEKKTRQAQEAIKQMETQIKRKETNNENKSKELAKSQKNYEVAYGKLEKQKEILEAKIQKLQKDLELKDKEIINAANTHKQKLESMESEIGDERTKRNNLDSEFNELKDRYAKLEAKCKEILESKETSKDMPIDKNHTEYEIQLYTELKRTKNSLAEKEKLIQKLQCERYDIVEAVNETDYENNSSNKKFTADVIKKSSELQTLKTQFAQLQNSYRKMQKKAEILENKLATVNHMQTQMKDSNRNVYNIQIMQLQQQITDLRSSLADVNAHNQELEKNCIQHQLKIEHYKTFLRNQDKDYKARKEMQQLLQKNGESCDEGPYHVVAVNSTTNNEDFQQLYASLENKELQVMKLEKLVKQMEKQEEQSQEQRTRLENRIAKLEVSLKEGQQTYRNRGFSFL